ncbi:Homeobox protein HAZ1 [Linum perenne]
MSKPDHMGVSPSQVSNTKSYSCPKQTPGEQTREFTTECRNNATLTEEDQAVSAQTVLLDRDAAVSTNMIAKTSEPSVQEVSKHNVIKTSCTQLEDASMESQIDKNGRLEQIAEDQKPDCACEHEQGTIRDAFSHREHVTEESILFPGSQQNQCQENGVQPLISSKETKQQLPEDVIMSDHSDLLRTACGNADRTNNSGGTCSPWQCATWNTDKTPSSIGERQQPAPEPCKQEIDSLSSSCNSLQHTPTNQKDMPSEIVISLPAEHSGLHNDDQISANSEQLKTASKEIASSSSCLERWVKTPISRKKCMSTSSAGCDRKLRSKSQDKQKATESSEKPTNVSSEREKRRARKKKRSQETVKNEYKRIRSHLRYLLHRMKFEQSLIVAYSGEGWKGQNLEKLKPEKELQRASSDIFRLKTKIRDLFKHIDSLCAEGRFPASLFDSDGEINSEDIYCAKCQSKEVTTENDIILCDGACDRGFHQFCLVPHLLKEDIPPDDEGWLCPGCDCKVDCIGFLNDYYGTNLSIGDSWEKVFPEAAATASATEFGSNFGLPSDDSDDDDYDPDGPEVKQKKEVDGSGSDESDFTSASEELGVSDDQKLLGLPSDDSEDDDYNPNGPCPNEIAKEESSGSDFSSDSEDLYSVLENDELPRAKGNLSFVQPGGLKNQSLNNELLSTSNLVDIVEGSHDEKYLGLPSDDSEDDDYNPDGPYPDEPMKEESSDFSSDSEDLDAVLENDVLPGANGNLHFVELDGMKNQSLNSELLSTSKAVETVDDSMSLARKRNHERLDYKKLYDETYGNGSSDSSDDEDYSGTVQQKARKISKKSAPRSTNRTGAVGNSVLKSVEIKQSSEGSEQTPEKRSGHMPIISNEHQGSSMLTPSRKRNAVYKKLGDAVTQRLRKSFEENRYPDHSTKEKLAKELDLTVRQIGKWFENSRWNYNHPATAAGSATKRSSGKKCLAVPGTDNKQLVEPQGGNHIAEDANFSGGQNELTVKKDDVAEKLQGDVVPKSAPRSRKRKPNKQKSSEEAKCEKAITGTTSSPMTSPVVVLGLRASR